MLSIVHFYDMRFAHSGKSYFSDLFEERVGPNSTLFVPIVSNMGNELQRNGLVVVVLVVLGKESVDFGFAPANAPYRKTFGGNRFVILHPSCWIVDPICLPIYFDGNAHNIAVVESIHERFALTFIAIWVLFKLFDVLFDAALDTKHKFRDFLIEQEGFFHGRISFAPPRGISKKIDLVNIVKMLKEVGKVVKDSPASRISQRVFFDCGLVSPTLVTRVKKLVRLNTYSRVEICLTFFFGGR